MARYEIMSNAYVTGQWQGVRLSQERRGNRFVGVGHTDDEAKATWFAMHGFTVTTDEGEPAFAVTELKRARHNAGRTSGPPLGEPLPEAFPARAELLEAGVRSLDAVALATDEEILAIKGVGRATLRRVREWQKP